MKLHSVFYNYMYNHLSPTGQSKYGWGVGEFDFHLPLKEQILKHNKENPEEVFNFNLTALNPIISQSVEQTEIFKKDYDCESLYDLSRDMSEAISEDFNPNISKLPKDVNNFIKGNFTVTITWNE